jgi:hypothetical protein
MPDACSFVSPMLVARHWATFQQRPLMLSVPWPIGAGKRDLPPPLRNRFTEVWVAEPSERPDLLALAAACLAGATPQPPLDVIVDFYVTAKAEAVGVSQ